MECSEARLEANRKNAQLSKGPTTPEGKSRSRLNAIKHGLCCKDVLPEEPEQIEARVNQVFEALRPQNEFQAWLVDHVAVCTLRIDRCERMERRARKKIALRAELTWDEDRKLEVEILGGSLAKHPAETVQMLRRSPHGCDWLIVRWALLAQAAENNGSWNEEQTTLAFDLMATHSLFRLGNQPGVMVDSEGNVLVATERPVELARRMVAELRERRAITVDLDEVERALTETDHDDSDAEIRKLRRYESTLHTRLRWAVALIREDPMKRPYLGAMRFTWIKANTPKTDDEIAAEKHDPTSFHPPFDLVEKEFPPLGQKADVPAILNSRKRERIAAVESKRAARRKQASKLHS
jgi:hypothetical protein